MRIFSENRQISYPKLNHRIWDFFISLFYKEILQSKLVRYKLQSQVAAGVGTHDVVVLKAKHANWIVEIYNKFQSDKGVTIIKSGFRKADITEAIEI